MKPLTQTILYDPTPGAPKGNCWQTVVASVLEKPLEGVPHFVQINDDGGENWYMHTYRWCWDQGYELKGYRKLQKRGYCLVTGKSPRGDFQHSVIYKNGRLFHDPHPSGAGVETEEEFETLRKRQG